MSQGNKLELGVVPMGTRSGGGGPPLPVSIANGGTNNSAAYSAGSVVFSDGSKLTEDNANFFWDGRLGIGVSPPAGLLDLRGGGGQLFFNMKASSSGTSGVYGEFQNDGGDFRFGVDSAAGGYLFIGTSPYASAFGSISATDFQIGANSIMRMTLKSAGTAVDFTLADNGAQLSLVCDTELVSVASGVTQQDSAANLIRAGSIIVACTFRTTVQPGGTATVFASAATDGQSFSQTVSTAAGTTDYGIEQWSTTANKMRSLAAQKVRLTFNAATTDALGRIRVSVWQFVITPPTS